VALAGVVACLLVWSFAGRARAADYPVCSGSGTPIQVTCTFRTTGSGTTWTVPQGVSSVTFHLIGGVGDGNEAGGGQTSATVATEGGQSFEIVVGGRGGLPTGGFNGGGAGGLGGGGGATDVRAGSCAATASCPLSARILVAGGGGGGENYEGGNGGGLAGLAGASEELGSGIASGGNGGTQTSGGTGGTGPTASGTAGGLGQGGAGAVGGVGGGGGGGGYYGGGGGGYVYDAAAGSGGEGQYGGGGGGSGFISSDPSLGITNGSTTAGSDSDQGLAMVTYQLASAIVSLKPASDRHPVGSPLTYTAAVTDTSGIALGDVTVHFAVTGANPQTASASTSGEGLANFTYAGANPGTDTVTAYIDRTGAGVQEPGDPAATATMDWFGPPASVSITPSRATDPVGATARFVATVRDVLDQPVPAYPVTFSVTGDNTEFATVNTDSDGLATFSYTGTTPGHDTITANSNGVTGTATATWTGPSPVVAYGGDFGDVTVGTRGPSLPILIENRYPRPLTITGAALAPGSGDFAVTGDECAGQVLAQYAICAVYVSVTPSAAGARTATLVLTDDGFDSPQSIPLTATGIAPASGQAGPAGPTGPAGSAGAPGAPGNVACRDVSAARELCTLLFAPGTWTVSGSSMTVTATLSRDGRTYAVATTRGLRRSTRLVFHIIHALAHDRYRLTIHISEKGRLTRTYRSAIRV
jgi:hypothetical protein